MKRKERRKKKKLNELITDVVNLLILQVELEVVHKVDLN